MPFIEDLVQAQAQAQCHSSTVKSMTASLATPLRQHFLASGWPDDERALDATLSWLAGLEIHIALDLADLGMLSSLPGAQSLQPGILAFLQVESEVSSQFVRKFRHTRPQLACRR